MEAFFPQPHFRRPVDLPTAAPIKDSRGKHITGLFKRQDITENKQAELNPLKNA
ncbi:MAG: hypothetical protein R2874_17450 [Desulfobacterales bacterium]